jgi:Domain of unknown function (DUF4365)
VLVVLYDPEAQAAYWQEVTADSAEPTGQGWKLLVPFAQRLDADAIPELARLAESDEYTQRLNALRGDMSWMALLRDGGRVQLAVGEWINKTSGRGAISIVGEPAGGGTTVQRSREVYLGLTNYGDLLPLLFPWADLEVDEQIYTEHEQQLWELEEGHYDAEDGRLIMAGSTFEEWRELRGLSGLRPYVTEADEFARWQLTLSLNELGHSFLAVDGHLGGYGEDA